MRCPPVARARQLLANDCVLAHEDEARVRMQPSFRLPTAPPLLKARRAERLRALGVVPIEQSSLVAPLIFGATAALQEVLPSMPRLDAPVSILFNESGVYAGQGYERFPWLEQSPTCQSRALELVSQSLTGGDWAYAVVRRSVLPTLSTGHLLALTSVHDGAKPQVDVYDPGGTDIRVPLEDFAAGRTHGRLMDLWFQFVPVAKAGE